MTRFFFHPNPAERALTISLPLIGGILYASALGEHILVVNTQEDAEELFERRSAKYSGRPDIPIFKM
jgi:hypothetical protein